MASVIRGNDNFDSGVVGSTTTGAVGTYALLRGLSGAATNAGSTSAGSGLYYTDTSRSYNGSPSAGTWKCMGYGLYGDRATVWLRIS